MREMTDPPKRQRAAKTVMNVRSAEAASGLYPFDTAYTEHPSKFGEQSSELTRRVWVVTVASPQSTFLYSTALA